MRSDQNVINSELTFQSSTTTEIPTVKISIEFVYEIMISREIR